MYLSVWSRATCPRVLEAVQGLTEGNDGLHQVVSLNLVAPHATVRAGRPLQNPTLHNSTYNTAMPSPSEIKGQKYISLASFRKNGDAVYTPVWFGEKGDKLYVMTRSDSGKYKRIKNNPKVRIASCTMRGKITGPEFGATVRMLPHEDWPSASETIKRKYWLARIPFFWSKQNVYLEVEVAT
jgi:PPOX class probable F420-dependent enzyme